MNYSEFSFEERSFIQIGLSEGLSRRAIGRQLKRSHTAVIREINRNSPDGVYQACKAQKLRNQRRQPLFEQVRSIDLLCSALLCSAQKI